MRKSRKNIASDLRKVDAHRIAPHEYNEAPELTEAQLAGAVLTIGGKPVRGRPRLEKPNKVAVKLRLDARAVERFRATGAGWQTRINAAVVRAAKKIKARA